MKVQNKKVRFELFLMCCGCVSMWWCMKMDEIYVMEVCMCVAVTCIVKPCVCVVCCVVLCCVLVIVVKCRKYGNS